jgi:hypothetical protein
LRRDEGDEEGNDIGDGDDDDDDDEEDEEVVVNDMAGARGTTGTV